MGFNFFLSHLFPFHIFLLSYPNTHHQIREVRVGALASFLIFIEIDFTIFPIERFFCANYFMIIFYFLFFFLPYSWYQVLHGDLLSYWSWVRVRIMFHFSTYFPHFLVIQIVQTIGGIWCILPILHSKLYFWHLCQQAGRYKSVELYMGSQLYSVGQCVFVPVTCCYYYVSVL